MQLKAKNIEFSQTIGQKVWYVDNQLVHDCLEFYKKHPELYHCLEIKDVFKKGFIADIEHGSAKISHVSGWVSLVDTIPLDGRYTDQQIEALKKRVYISVISAQRHVASGEPELYQGVDFPSKKPIVTAISSDGYAYAEGRGFGDRY